MVISGLDSAILPTRIFRRLAPQLKPTVSVVHTLKAAGLTLLICTNVLITATRAADNLGEAIPSASDSAIVRLEIPLQRHNGARLQHVTEHCSGTLIDRAKGMILTAWHCFDGNMDLTRPPTAWIRGRWHQVRLAVHGGEINNDWAIAYVTDPSSIDEPAMPYELSELSVGLDITMVGYQRMGKKNSSEWLKAATSCKIARHGDDWIETNCRLNKGASGGAVVSMHQGQPNLIGIISAKSSEGGVWFVPLTRLRTQLSPP